MDGWPPEVARWLDGYRDEQRERVEFLASLVRSAGEDIDQAIKWQRLTFTRGGDWHQWLCAISVTKSDVKLAFHKGSMLDDPAGLLVGDGRYVRQATYDRAAANPDAITAMVRQAIARQTDML